MYGLTQFGLLGLTLTLFGFSASGIGAANDTGKAETLPPPRIVIVEEDVPAEVALATLPFLRTNRYAVWQAYGVDRQGHFRARVIEAPFGAYYQYNGKPYPWSTVVPLRLSPSIVR